MAFCAKCGAQLKDGSAFCAACGAPAGQSASASSGAAAAPAPAASAGMSSNAAACLAYLFGWITGLIFLLIEPYKRDRFVRFNAFQAIFMDVAVIAISFGLGILSFVLGIISHGFAGLVMLPLWPLMWLAFLATKIYLMVKAYGNQEVKLPFIGDFAAKQASSM